MKVFLNTIWIGICLVSFVEAAWLAKVGNKEITDDMVRSEYDMMDKEQKAMINKDQTTKKNIVDNSINSELLIQAAVKAGLENDNEYKKALERFRRQYLASKMMEKSIEPRLSKSDVRKYFDSNKHLFDSTQACAQHIVVSDEATAHKVLNEIKGHKKFDVVAKKYSMDPTVQDNGGDLGCFTRDKMVAEFSQAAFNMKKGDIKGPVKTVYGYHIIKLTDLKPGKTPNYDEVEQRAKEAYRVKLLQDIIADLRTKNGVKLNDEAIKSFKF